MGGSAWRDQFAAGFPTLWELGGPGAYPPSSDFSGMITMVEILKEASSRFVTAKKGLALKLRNSGLKLYPRRGETGPTDPIDTRPQESFGWKASYRR